MGNGFAGTFNINCPLSICSLYAQSDCDSDSKLRIKHEPGYKAKFTLSGNPQEKEEFLQFIKERGLYDRLVSFHSGKLNSLMKGDSLSDEVRDALMEFLVLEEGKPRFFLSKLSMK